MPTRNLQPGDVVSVLDNNALKPQYYIALITQVYPSTDGVVRKVSISYKNFPVMRKFKSIAVPLINPLFAMCKN